MLAGLETPTSGRVWVGDTELTGLGEDEIAELRRESLGIVFQAFGLIPILSAAENVELALRIARTPPSERDEPATEAPGPVAPADPPHPPPAEAPGGPRHRG